MPGEVGGEVGYGQVWRALARPFLFWQRQGGLHQALLALFGFDLAAEDGFAQGAGALGRDLVLAFQIAAHGAQGVDDVPAPGAAAASSAAKSPASKVRPRAAAKRQKMRTLTSSPKRSCKPMTAGEKPGLG